MKKVFAEYHRGPITDVASELAEIFGDLAAYHAAISDRLQELRETGKTLDALMLDPKTRVLLRTYETSMERQAKLLAEAVKLGIINRSVSVEETTANILLQAVSSALKSRGYDDDPALQAEIANQIRNLQDKINRGLGHPLPRAQL